MWHLIATLNPYDLVESILHWTPPKYYKPEIISTYLSKKKKRLYRSYLNDYPSCIQCYVFGKKGSGKKSFLSGQFVDKTADETIYSINRMKLTLPVVQIDRNGKESEVNVEKEFYLVLVLHPESKVQEILEKDRMLNCDVCCLIYDGSDKHSFEELHKIQNDLIENDQCEKLPCVYIKTKDDLRDVRQVMTVLHEDEDETLTPEEFCTSLGLPWPPINLSLKKLDFSNERERTLKDLMLCLFLGESIPCQESEKFQLKLLKDEGGDEDVTHSGNSKSNILTSDKLKNVKELKKEGTNGLMFAAAGSALTLLTLVFWKYFPANLIKKAKESK